VLERTEAPDPHEPARMVGYYAVRHMKRFHLGTSYVDVVADVGKMFEKAPLENTNLLVDMTGVGRPVVDMLRRAQVRARLRPITVTFGHRAQSDLAGGYCVPKVELVAVLQVLLQSRRIKVAQSLPDAAMLVKELQNFQVKITAAKNEV